MDLDQLWADIEEYGVEPEHMDRLALFASRLGVPGARAFADSFERWGVDSTQFEVMFNRCLNRQRADALSLPTDIAHEIAARLDLPPR